MPTIYNPCYNETLHKPEIEMNFDDIDELMERGITNGLNREMLLNYADKYPETFVYFADKFPQYWQIIGEIEPVKVERVRAPRIEKLTRKPMTEHITVEMVEQVARSCASRREFNHKHSGVYRYAVRHGIDVSQWLPTKHQKRLSEAQALVTMFGWDGAMQTADGAMRQWLRDHKEMLEKP